MSRTVTLNEAEPVFPCASAAVHVTTVVATAKMEPDAGVQLVGREPSIASVAEAEKLTGAPAADVASAVMSAGTETVGFVVSCTVT